MATVTARGFTIIELMLFLGVTGALFAALMVGVNMNITQQRYRGSVDSFSSLLQNQYSNVLNTQNDRGANWQCANDGTISQSVSGDPRGTTECVILGRAVEIEQNGDGTSSIKTSSVAGCACGNTIQNDISDSKTLADYNPKIVPNFNQQTTPIDWGSTLVMSDGKPSTASFLILRSPASGLLKVYGSASTLPTGANGLKDIILDPNASTTKLTVCVQGDSGSLPTESVSINPLIASSDGVKVNPKC